MSQPIARAAPTPSAPLADSGVLRAIPGSPVPAGAASGHLVTADEIRIRFAHWPPTPGAPRRGTVTLLPGRAEFIEKYYEVVRDLTARGFAVATLDWRGQGGSERLLANPRRGYVADFLDYQRDLAAFMRHVVLPDCPAPHYALAHSMGGAVLLDALLAGHRWFDRAVMAAPMLAINLGPITGAVGMIAAAGTAVGLGRAYVPGGGDKPINFRPFEINRVTSDPVRYARAADFITQHPELGLGSPTLRWLTAAFAAMRRITAPEALRTIRQPLLLMAGGADRIVSNRMIEHVASRLIAGAQLVVPAAKHELMMERDALRSQFWAAFDGFIPPTPLPGEGARSRADG
ncbi:alpha/beta hydrolase [Aquabacter sp. L1I39]|uniref:alpha/beta fold hydrolase n=1 Tax=Aquabacter sp. L1I39 TaxID=2820278 RepID=UPI001AD9DEC4|nr:alpha/beta hydrolase [Aquabacter sp. L1I39]QTL01824.1 alpha/beta hydrolase [Aquabacter sp. L1I39]